MLIVTGGMHRSGTTWLYNVLKTMYPTYKSYFAETFPIDLGIGIPNINMLWNETNQHEMLVGWPNPQVIDIKQVSEISYNNKDYKMIDNNIKFFLKNPWVQCPQIPEVEALLSKLSIVNYCRGSGKARCKLDELEKKYRVWIKDIVDVTDFKYFYFVNGVTDAINQWIATEDRLWQYVEGDYEYANMISNQGTKVSKILSDRVLYISNPSCATGNFINIEEIEVPVILDCAYIGSTEKKKINLPKNTEQVWFSFSKGWGLIGQRAGIVFSKTPHKSLELMKNVEAWNYTGVEVALTIVNNFEIDTVRNWYINKQKEICDKYNFQPADCFFIANSTDTIYKKRRRTNNVARLDLSRLIQK
jgi:hypothetical protein